MVLHHSGKGCCQNHQAHRTSTAHIQDIPSAILEIVASTVVALLQMDIFAAVKAGDCNLIANHVSQFRCVDQVNVKVS